MFLVPDPRPVETHIYVKMNEISSSFIQIMKPYRNGHGGRGIQRTVYDPLEDMIGLLNPSNDVIPVWSDGTVVGETKTSL